jgi:dTDP-4-amino-4,6-dideoxygalactose transaminase
MAKTMGLKSVHLPVTDRVAEQLLRLPCYFGLEPDIQYQIIQHVHDFFATT